MFYSHEILTSREGGIATVWLVATLGSKANNKKVNRKSILEVDVKKTCDIIIQPDAPMALRLQGNLLYGVVRVYSRQFEYVLSDAETIQANIRALLKAVKTSELDPNAGKARPDQLMIQDDPSFLPDLALPGLDIDLSALDMTTDSSSHLSSILSPHSQRSSLSSGQDVQQSALALVIPSSAGSGGRGGFDLPSDPPGSAFRSGGLERPMEDDEDFNIDLGFGFDENGNMFEEPTRSEQVQQGDNVNMGGDVTATGNVREGQAEEGVQGRVQEDDFFNPNFNDDPLLPYADAFPTRTAEAAAADNNAPGSSHQTNGHGTESSYGAPLQRKKRVPKKLPTDEVTTIHNSELGKWKANYLENMKAATAAQAHRKEVAIGKKNAKHWMVDMGIGGMGPWLRKQSTKSPLLAFSGQAWFDELRGISSTARKRARDEDDASDADDEGRNVRAKDSQVNLEGDDLLQDDDAAPGFAEEGIEIGRHAQPPMDDPSLPWNVTASSRQGSIVQGRSFQASIGGFPTSIGGRSASVSGLPRPSSIDRRGSRIASASPLQHRGPHRHSSLDRHIHQDEESNFNLGDDQNITDPQALEDFELHGPGAFVPTQTAADSQWVKAALTQEANNFLEFVRAEIDARQLQALQGEEEVSHEGKQSVLFEELLPPAQHSKTVGAQGFYHLLALATGDRLRVEQLGGDDIEGFGSIRLELPDAK